MGTSYCDIAPGHEWHGPYHDTEYGFPLDDDAALFERLGQRCPVIIGEGLGSRRLRSRRGPR